MESAFATALEDPALPDSRFELDDLPHRGGPTGLLVAAVAM
ncbi:MAG: hypothetical protein AAFX86_11730 [Pseudomonadota bacterium]